MEDKTIDRSMERPDTNLHNVSADGEASHDSNDIIPPFS